MSFSEKILQNRPYSMEKFIEISIASLDEVKRLEPWKYVNHGTELLQTEEELCAYIAAYGEMHEKKCRTALQSIKIEELGVFEIWDWGCGQGLASLTCIDMLRERNKLNYLKKVTLIEPSEIALERAALNIRTACPHLSIITINKFLPSGNDSDNQIKSVNYTVTNIIHLFSNILDIESINLIKLASLVAEPGHNHYVMSFGPLNKGANRIDQFASIFNGRKNLLQITNYEFGYTENRRKRFTCKSNCFLHNGNSLNRNYDQTLRPCTINGIPLENDYDVEGWIKQAGICERVIPFYRRLERDKELNEHDSLFISPKINGDKIDFVLVRPSKGILLLKVIEGKPIYEDLKTSINEIKQIQGNLIRKYLDELWGKIITNDKSIWSIVKMGLVFPDMSCSEIHNWLKDMQQKDGDLKIQILGKAIACGIDFVKFIGNDSLTDTPGAMQLGWFAPIYQHPNFKETTYKSILRILSPGWHSYKEGKGIELDRIQEKLASYPNVTKQISGFAGSGKTQVLVQRAVNTHRVTGEVVLILSYNLALTNYLKYRLNQVKADFSRGAFEIMSYHRFFKRNALSLNLKPIKNINRTSNINSYSEEKDEYEYSYDNPEFFRSKENETKRYRNILIDEAQDFKQEWIQIIKQYFLAKDGEIVVFGDASQNIYNRPLDNKHQIKIEVSRNGWNNSLDNSYNNSTPKRFLNQALAELIFKFNKKFILKSSEAQTTPPRILDLQEIKSFFYYQLSAEASAEAIAERCNSIIDEYNIHTTNVAIVSNHTQILREIERILKEQYSKPTKTTFASQKEIDSIVKNNSKHSQQDIRNLERSKKINFTVENLCIKISSIHSFKGWETPNLILIIESSENNSELIYTALTRARERIFLINCGNQLYGDFFTNYQ